MIDYGMYLNEGLVVEVVINDGNQAFAVLGIDEAVKKLLEISNA